VKVRFSAPVHTVPGAHPASYTMGTGSFPGVIRPGRGVDHQFPTSAEVKERVDLYVWDFVDCYGVNFTFPQSSLWFKGIIFYLLHYESGAEETDSNSIWGRQKKRFWNSAKFDSQVFSSEIFFNVFVLGIWRRV